MNRHGHFDAFARALEKSFGIKAERASETEFILRRAG